MLSRLPFPALLLSLALFTCGTASAQSTFYQLSNDDLEWLLDGGGYSNFEIVEENDDFTSYEIETYDYLICLRNWDESGLELIVSFYNDLEHSDRQLLRTINQWNFDVRFAQACCSNEYIYLSADLYFDGGCTEDSVLYFIDHFVYMIPAFVDSF